MNYAMTGKTHSKGSKFLEGVTDLSSAPTTTTSTPTPTAPTTTDGGGGY